MIRHNRMFGMRFFRVNHHSIRQADLEGCQIRAVPGITYRLNQVIKIAAASTKGNVLLDGVRLENSLVTEGWKLDRPFRQVGGKSVGIGIACNVVRECANVL